MLRQIQTIQVSMMTGTKSGRVQQHTARIHSGTYMSTYGFGLVSNTSIHRDILSMFHPGTGTPTQCGGVHGVHGIGIHSTMEGGIITIITLSLVTPEFMVHVRSMPPIGLYQIM